MSTSKTPEQIKEVMSNPLFPTGCIIDVPSDSPPFAGFLELNGQTVLKTDYPRLADALKSTPFDQGDNLVLDPNFMPPNASAYPGNKFLVKT